MGKQSNVKLKQRAEKFLERHSDRLSEEKLKLAIEKAVRKITH